GCGESSTGCGTKPWPEPRRTSGPPGTPRRAASVTPPGRAGTTGAPRDSCRALAGVGPAPCPSFAAPASGPTSRRQGSCPGQPGILQGPCSLLPYLAQTG